MFYLVGLGLAVPLGNLVLDRLAGPLRVGRWEAIIVVTLGSLLWVLQIAATLDLRRLALPALVGLTLVLVSRLRRPGEQLVLTATAAPLRHFAFLLVPLLTAAMALGLWPILGGLETNWPIAILSSLAAVGLYLWAIIRATRRPAVTGIPATPTAASAPR